MASSTPSAPINSSRGAADTTADRIYFSTTPSAQVRLPVGDLVFPPPLPHFCSHYTTRGKIIRERQRTADGGKIIPRRRKNYSAAE